MSNYSHITQESYQLSRTSCVSVNDSGHIYVKMIAKTIATCDQRFKCLKLTKRTPDILEIQEGIPTDLNETACEETYFKDKVGKCC